MFVFLSGKYYPAVFSLCPDDSNEAELIGTAQLKRVHSKVLTQLLLPRFTELYNKNLRKEDIKTVQFGKERVNRLKLLIVPLPACCKFP